MSSARIHLDRVDLHYSMLAFKERALKTLILNRLSARRRPPPVHDVHALKSICLDIGPGERVGLLGHNGAGKSTLLKVLAGLYPTSSGVVEVDGEIRSLFELSLGFEPEATGRENILYRGLLMGLAPSYMRAIEGEIVEFAEIGEFIDYPIKTYSAGMTVRLAFAISTAVGGNILLLDEVIGAGDAAFMEKAKQRVTQLIENSDILVLASHDFGALHSLCTRCLVLHHGEIVHDGLVAGAITEYKKINGLAP
jgi:lipopolysaccharide transport system ATP-binding protein